MSKRFDHEIEITPEDWGDGFTIKIEIHYEVDIGGAIYLEKVLSTVDPEDILPIIPWRMKENFRDLAVEHWRDNHD